MGFATGKFSDQRAEALNLPTAALCQATQLLRTLSRRMDPREPLQDSAFKISDNHMSVNRHAAINLQSLELLQLLLVPKEEWTAAPFGERSVSCTPANCWSDDGLCRLQLHQAHSRHWCATAVSSNSSACAQAPCAQVPRPGVSCETGKTYRHSRSYLSNTPLANVLKGCWCWETLWVLCTRGSLLDPL